MEDEIDREIESHIAMRIEDNLAAGMSPAQAQRDARLRFGNPIAIRERTAESDTALYLEGLWTDTRYALRQLLRSPGFALSAILTLALGIGVNLAVFQLLRGVLFVHLPVPHPEQLSVLHAAQTPFDHTYSFSFPAYRRLRNATANTAPVSAHGWIGRGVLQESNGSSTPTDFQLLSDNFFPVLNLSPFAGRFFFPGDDARPQLEWPAVLRYGFFQQHFSGDLSVLGKHALVNGVPVVIVGIAPRNFNGVLQWDAPDIWLPLAAQSTGKFGTWFDSLGPGFDVHLDKPWLNQPTIFWLYAIARVPKNSDTPAAAQWTSVLAPDLALMASQSRDQAERQRILATQLQLVSAASGEARLDHKYGSPLKILMAMAAAVLLIGCLNLANLQSSRLAAREREIAIRIALGASRARVLRQAAIEAALLAIAGGALAFLAAGAASSLLLSWASGRGRPINIDLSMNFESLALGAALILTALLVFTLLPAWQIARKNFSTHRTRTSKLSGQSKGQSKAARRWSNLLLAGQVSCSLLLLTAAALFAQTLRNIAGIDTGMDRDHIVSVHLDMGDTGFAEKQQNLPALYDRILDRLRSLPMATDAALSSCDIPQCGWNTILHVFGHPELPEAQLHGEENVVGIGYFRTLGIPLLAGRDFSSHDNLQSQKVAILNRSYARQLFGAEDPIGRWVGYNSSPGDRQFQVVGLVADARVDGVRTDAPPILYVSHDQFPDPAGTIEVRARGSLAALPSAIRDALREVAPALPVTEIVPLNAELEDSLTTEDLLARLTAIFAALALALAALGFYSLISFRVARRTSEIGLRMALGANRRDVLMLFLRQTVNILLVGAVPGILLSLGLRKLVANILYGPSAMSLWALAFALVVLASAGVLATLHPARRAASVNPVDALRAE